MRKAFKIVLATGVILGASWITPVLGVVFLLVFLGAAALARHSQGLPNAISADEHWEEEEWHVNSATIDTSTINPATGLPAEESGGIDIAGHPYGIS